MTTLAYVVGADRMITAAKLAPEGLFVRFADEREGMIPFARLALPETPTHVKVPRPHVIEIHLPSGGVEEVPWDFARHFADDQYRAESEATLAEGRLLFADRLRACRTEKGLTQRQLAEKAEISRVSIARMETGEQHPRYSTLLQISQALQIPAERLVTG